MIIASAILFFVHGARGEKTLGYHDNSIIAIILAHLVIRIETSLVAAEVSRSFNEFFLDLGGGWLVLLYSKLMLLVD